MLKVTAAAIVGEDGKIYSLPPPARHHHIIHYLAELGHSTPITGKQGFLLSDGTFANRIHAKFVAANARQIISSTNKHELFSEDLW